MRRLASVVAGMVVLGLAVGCGASGSGTATIGTVASGAGGTSGPGVTARPSGGSTTSDAEAKSEESPGIPGVDRQLTAAVASYRGYLLGEVAAVRSAASSTAAAIHAGDLAGARAGYLAGRLRWGRLRPALGTLTDLNRVLDAPLLGHDGPTDPTFTGWHRVEYALWVTGSTSAARPYADRLVADLTTLSTRLGTVRLTAAGLVTGARLLVETLVARALVGTEEAFSHSDLADVAAGVEGVQAVFRAVTPIVAPSNPTLVAALSRDLASAAGGVAAYRISGGGYRPVTAVPAADRTRLRAHLDAVRSDVLRLAAMPGLH